MWKLKTKIKYKINLWLNYFRYLSNKSLIIVKHKIYKAHNTHVNNLVWYLSIAFVTTLMILFNMSEYMRYIDAKYSLWATIDSSYSYNESENIALNSAEEIENIIKEALIIDKWTKKEAVKINETNNGEMTTWWGKVDIFNKIELIKSLISTREKNDDIEKKDKIIVNDANNQNIETKTLDIKEEAENQEDNTSNVEESNINITEEYKDKINKEEKVIINTIEKIDNIKINDNLTKWEIYIEETKKTEPKIQEYKKTEPKIKEQVIVTAKSNDELANSINNEITTELNKLNWGIFNWFRIKILKNKNIILENWVWYTYSYSKYHWFGRWIVPSESDLSDGWLNKDNHILLLWDNNWAMFVTDYKKIKLISDYIISDISNKQAFLNELADEKKYLPEDTDQIFISLKNATNNLTNWANNSQKIQKIYDYILKNVSYSKVFNVNNKYIFSWIHTFDNNDWICTWYARLYLYMLSFAGVENVKLIKWNIVDAVDFPNIWHAWIQIWYNYYDPTFDDPIWNIWTKSYDEYNYFWLPRDLFYTNRFNYGELPNNLKNSDLETRKKYVKDELNKLQSKYSDYNLIKSITN